MIRFYSLFVKDNDLLSSPYIRKLNLFHDLTVNRGAEEKVNFLLQSSLTPEQSRELNIIYDPLAINVTNVETKSFKHQTLVTVTLIPREVGSVKIGLAYPQSKAAHRRQISQLPSPLVSTPCHHISQPNYLKNSVKIGEYVA
jgi:hypothetical protein